MWLSKEDSNRSVVIDAEPAEVWETIVDEEARTAWLDDDRPIDIESVEEERRLVWWWAGEEGLSRVEIELVPLPGPPTHTRVTVTESFPLKELATCFALVA